MVAWLKDLEQGAPTIGSTLGAIGGGLLGGGIDVATLGAAAPLVNPFSLGTLGAGLGGAAGQGIENATQPKGYQQNPLKTGAEDAAFNVLGAGVGKGLGVLAKGAKSVVAPSIVHQSANILDHPTAQYLADNGVNSFDEAKGLAGKITGAPGGEGAVMTNAVTNAANNSKNAVDLTPEFQNWNAPLDTYGDLGPTEAKISKNVNRILGKVVQDSGGNVTNVPVKGAAPDMTIPNSKDMQKITPGAALKASKVLRKMAATAGNGARDAKGTVINEGKAAASDTYNALGRAIEDKIFGADEAGNAAVPLTTADKQSMKDDLLKVIGKSNPQLYGKMAGDIDDATTYADIRSAQRPFVNVSEAGNAAEQAAAKAPGKPILGGTVGAGLGFGIGGPVGAGIGGGAGMLAQHIAENPAAEKVGSKFAAKAANVLARMGKLPTPAGTVNPAAAATTALGSAAASPQPTAASSLTATAPQGGSAMPPTTATQPGAAPNIFGSLTGSSPAYMQPLALQAMMGMFDPNLLSQYTTPATAAANTLQQTQEAQTALQALENTRNQIAGAQQGGGLLGTIHNILSRGQASPLAGGYTSQAQQLDTLLKSLGAPTQAPSLALNPQAGQNQFGAIQQFLTSLGASQPAATTQ